MYSLDQLSYIYICILFIHNLDTLEELLFSSQQYRYIKQ